MSGEKRSDGGIYGGERRAKPLDARTLRLRLPLDLVAERLELFARHLRIRLMRHLCGAALHLGERAFDAPYLARERRTLVRELGDFSLRAPQRFDTPHRLSVGRLRVRNELELGTRDREPLSRGALLRRDSLFLLRDIGVLAREIRLGETDKLCAQTVCALELLNLSI